ncbi:MAG: hypothetical protein LBB87_03780 [Nitrososphaerota archaeon]|jgi:hypothetical protein|nr:hypothetical protein [Nitrososphaerota archaeon]
MTSTTSEKGAKYFAIDFIYNHSGFHGVSLFLTRIVEFLLFLDHPKDDQATSIKTPSYSTSLFNKTSRPDKKMCHP